MKTKMLKELVENWSSLSCGRSHSGAEILPTVLPETTRIKSVSFIGGRKEHGEIQITVDYEGKECHTSLNLIDTSMYEVISKVLLNSAGKTLEEARRMQVEI